MGINHELVIMRVVMDSMFGITEPIEGSGRVSARGRMIGRINCVTDMQQVQQAAKELERQRILVMEDGVLRLDLQAANLRTRHYLGMVDSAHPAVTASKIETIRKEAYTLMNRLTQAVTGVPLAMPSPAV